MPLKHCKLVFKSKTNLNTIRNYIKLDLLSSKVCRYQLERSFRSLCTPETSLHFFFCIIQLGGIVAGLFDGPIFDAIEGPIKDAISASLGEVLLHINMYSFTENESLVSQLTREHFWSLMDRFLLLVHFDIIRNLKLKYKKETTLTDLQLRIPVPRL